MAKAKKDILKYVPDDIIVNKIYLIRGHKVMLDYALAALYEVETRRLNEQAKRNLEKFPPEFMFRVTAKEWQNMMSQNATSYSQNFHFQATVNMRSQFVTLSKKNMMSQNATSSCQGIKIKKSLTMRSQIVTA